MPISAQLAHSLVVGLDGPWPTGREWAWLHVWQPGGVILFSRNVRSAGQLKSLCAALKGACPGLLVSADHEGGPVSQLAAALGRPPAAWGLGRLDDADLTRRVHAETGRRLLWAGVDMVLAPCADVLLEPRNPVIGARSFGHDAEVVTRHVVAAVEGLRSSGVQVCLKHWPGHGAAAVDSHLGAPRVWPRPEEEAVFRQGTASGAEAVMPGHLLLDEGCEDPATMRSDHLAATRQFLDTGGRLRLVADDVSMGALRSPMAHRGVMVAGDPGEGMFDPGRLPLAWFQVLKDAGCDLLLVRGLPTLAFPCTVKDDTPPAAMDEVRPETLFNEGPYREARQRLLPCAGDFRGDRLVHLDLAAADRWQVAIGTGMEDHRKLVAGLEGDFAERQVSFAWDEAVAGEGPVGHVLVTSHRPLDRGWRQGGWFRDLLPRLNGDGHCVVMGHPSLAGELASALGSSWKIDACYDVTWEDLRGSY